MLNFGLYNISASMEKKDELPKEIPLIWKYVINVLMLLGLMGFCIFLISQIIVLWPTDTLNEFEWFGLYLNLEQRLFVLVVLGGALGSFIHIATSFTDFIGNRTIVYSWMPWYIMRPFVGSGLALIFYILLRAGLFSNISLNDANMESININPFGLMAIACLAGLFSKQATDKLREVFETLFQIKKKVERSDPLNTDEEDEDVENGNQQKKGKSGNEDS